MADEKFKGIVQLPDDAAYNTLIETGKYNDGETEITYNPNWLYVTPNTVASNIEQQKLQIEDLYSKLNNTVTVDGVQTITGPKTFQESIYLANTDGTTDRIAHINNNFIIYSGANNGVALLNIDEGLGTISAFNKQLAFKEDITGGGGGGTGNTTVYVADTAVEEVRFDSDPQTQISAKVSQEDFDNLIKNRTRINAENSLVANMNSFAIGLSPGTTPPTGTNNIMVGGYPQGSGRKNTVSVGYIARTENYAVAVGAYAQAGERSVSVGCEGYATGDNAILLGKGTNNTDNTLQIWGDNIYNHSTHTLTVQNIELNGDDIETVFDTKYLPTSGGTLTGGLSINGDLTIVGNITQQGSAYVSHAEQVYSTKDYIYLREGNTGALADDAYTGFEFIKYDGTNNGRLVVDNKGVARVGDAGDEQPLATREEEPTPNGFAKWDNTTSKFITDTDVAKDSELKSNYLPLSAGSGKRITGNLYLSKSTIMNNNIGYQGYDSGGNAKDLIRMAASNTIILGDTTHTGDIAPYNNVRPVAGKSLKLGTSDNKWSEIHGTIIYQNGNQVANADDLSSVTDATLSSDNKTITITKRDGTSFDFQGGGDVDLSGYITTNTAQTITGAKAFTGTVGNTQTEAGIYLGLDQNTGAENANMAIVSANTAAYIDMGRPNVDYDFRIIKWNQPDNKHAQFVYGGDATGTITIPQASGVMALTSDIPKFTLDGTTLIITL